MDIKQHTTYTKILINFFLLSNFTNHQNVMNKQNTQHCHEKFDEIIS
jgi:hypothetical protein